MICKCKLSNITLVHELHLLKVTHSQVPVYIAIIRILVLCQLTDVLHVNSENPGDPVFENPSALNRNAGFRVVLYQSESSCPLRGYILAKPKGSVA